MEAARASLGPILDQLGALLADDRQFVAGQYSFADIHWTAIAHLCTLAGETGLVESRSNVSAWFDRIVERTSRSGGSSTYQALATLDEVRNKQLKSAA